MKNRFNYRLARERIGLVVRVFQLIYISLKIYNLLEPFLTSMAINYPFGFICQSRQNGQIASR